MIASIVSLLLGTAFVATPCEGLSNLKLENATITSAEMVAEGPAPARGGRGGARGGGNAAAPLIPAHCRLRLVLTPSSDSLINMELWLPPADRWNGKFMGVGNGG